MFTRKGLLCSNRRGVVLVTIAALALTIATPPLATAQSVAPKSKDVFVTTASSDATDFSAARRRRHYHRGGNAAGLAFIGLAIGAIGAIAAQQRRDNYYNNYEYGYGPGYYRGDPYFYGGGPYYGRRYYRD